ncbi:hypothetical protein SUGI_0680300 [Cryptomeria japonica]|nr:hypothetical protein SUGI_0680300 [Cryptomeria japonica]
MTCASIPASVQSQGNQIAPSTSDEYDPSESGMNGIIQRSLRSNRNEIRAECLSWQSIWKGKVKAHQLAYKIKITPFNTLEYSKFQAHARQRIGELPLQRKAALIRDDEIKHPTAWRENSIG